MNGDLSRSTFDPSKAYSSVRAQQGRATLDADLNEQVDIQLHDARAGRRALIGPSGGHIGEAGFEIQIAGNQPRIQPGRYWVDGIEVALAGAPINVGAQVPSVALPTAQGLYLAYLDVWERPITAVQDPDIREVALGGPDTSVRTQVVWRVRLLPVTTNDLTPDCLTPFPEWQRLVAGPQGTLEVRVAASGAVSDPCLIPESAGFRGLENQLYRIEIHDGNFDPVAANGVGVGDPSFKWSRDNGSVIATWREHPSALEVVVDRLGPGGAAGFHPDNWVELSNDHDALLERGGVIARIADVDVDTLLLDDPNDPALASKWSETLHGMVRRWDSAGVRDTAVGNNQPDVTPDDWIRIEDGIEVRFANGPFRAGTYWTIPARTATLPGTADKQIDWPTGPGNVPQAVRATEPAHHYARLALLQLSGTTWTRLADCRQLFPQLTELTQLHTRGGDGQHGRANHWLPTPLSVAVLRGGFPVAGSTVRFQLVPSEVGNQQRGTLTATMPSEQGVGANLGPSIDVTTNGQGVATVWWRLGAGPAVEELGDTFQRDDAQEVTATLIAVDGVATSHSTRFTARVLDNYTLVAAGGDGQFGYPQETLELPLHARVSDGGRPVPGARVEFSVLNTAFEGQPLSGNEAGYLHASNAELLVSTTYWPIGNNLAQKAVVATDATGVAQVQWTLGSHIGLPVQRVLARLIDEASQPTTQQTQFSAHLSIASEITATIPAVLSPHMPPPVPDKPRDVQEALNGVATALQRLGLPLYAIVPRVVHVNNSRPLLEPSLTFPLSLLQAIELQAMFPMGFTANPTQLAAALSIQFERPFIANVNNVNVQVGSTFVRLAGTATQSTTTLRWVPAPNTRTWLESELEGGARSIVVELMPSALGMFGHPQQWTFKLTE